jgi:16S rRNA (cytosine1402-N4)-methyltransferase
VLVSEVLKYLMTRPEGIYVDGTAGSGGHSEAIGGKITTSGRLICLDRDAEAIRISRERLSHLGERVILIQGNYAELNKLLHHKGFGKVQGVLLDLGMSSYQLEQSGRGFSFTKDEPLDMRMDVNEEITAARLINQLTQRDIEYILRDYGEEKRAKVIAAAVVKERKKKSVDTSLQLANLVTRVIPSSRQPGMKHPATRTFQALRIAVNISYHSLEDRRVKQTMMAWEKGCQCPSDLPVCTCERKPLFKRLFKKAIRPGEKEVKTNPRARSALLRAAERI